MKISYTFKKTSRGYELSAIDQDHQIIIAEDHPKYEWVSNIEADRLININPQGHFNSSKDYHNAYGNKTTQSPKVTQPTLKPLEINLTKLDDLNIDSSLFVPLATNTIFDKFVSAEGGFLPGTNIMMVGMPGSGKTTVGVDLIASLHAQGKKVLFISAEMNQLDMVRYLKRFPHWGQVPMLFMADYSEYNSKDVIESILNEGWDLVFTDSFSEVCDTVKEDAGMSRGSVEKWFLQLMDQNNIANNKLKKYTTFMTILQVGKSGIFSGSNKLKHMSSAMVHLEWEGSENSGRRYMYFSKNRAGQVGKKLYYELLDTVTFDEERYIRDLFNEDILAEERKSLNSEGSAFNKLFGFDQDGIPAELKTQIEL